MRMIDVGEISSDVRGMITAIAETGTHGEGKTGVIGK